MSKKRLKKKRTLNYADVIVSFLVISIIGLIIIPLPAIALDILIVINLAVAININNVQAWFKYVFNPFDTDRR